MKKILLFLVAALLMGATNCSRQVADPSDYQAPTTTPNRPDAVRSDDYNPAAGTNARRVASPTQGITPVAGNNQTYDFTRSGEVKNWGSAWAREVENEEIKKKKDYLERLSSVLYTHKHTMTSQILWDGFSMCAWTVRNLHGERPNNPEGVAIKVTRNLLLLKKYAEDSRANRTDPALLTALEEMLQDLSFLPTHLAASVMKKKYIIENQIDLGWGTEDDLCLSHECAEYAHEWKGKIKAVPL